MMPIIEAVIANPFAVLCAHASSLGIRYKDMPDTAKQRAVFAFIVTKPGKMLFNAAISKTQPVSTREPIMVTAMLEPFEKELKEEIRCG